MISGPFPYKCSPLDKEINKNVRLEVAFLGGRNYYNSARCSEEQKVGKQFRGIFYPSTDLLGKNRSGLGV